MSQSLHNLWVHIIFTTKHREKIIHAEIEPELYSYISSVLKYRKALCLIINGDSDHIHILTKQSKICTVPKLIEEIKKSSSKWIKSKNPRYSKFRWQSGYGAFSVAPIQVDTVKKYIEKQKIHNKKKSFQEEYREFLQQNKIMYDEKYIWD